MLNVTVVPGDTLSGIAASHDVSLSSVEAANPQITNPNLIFPGEQVMVPAGGSYSSWTPGSSPSPSTQPSPASTVSTAGSYSGSGLGDVPGVPVAFATCVAARESSDNPKAVNQVIPPPAGGGGAYGFIESTWDGMGAVTAGYAEPYNAPVSVQKAAFSALYRQAGTEPWTPSDHCGE